MRVCLATIFLFHFVALLGLIAAPDEAVAEIAAGDNGISYRPGKEYRAIPGELKLWSDDDYKAILLSQSEYPIADEQPIGEDEKAGKTKKAVEPITRKLPIWGEKVRAMGYELPLPFGAGVNLVYMEQGIDIKNEEHWNFLMGGQWEITKRWQITAEGGVGNRRQIVVGSSFRF